MRMSIAPSYWDRQETGVAGQVRLARTMEEGRAPSPQGKDNSEGKGKTSMPRNITPRHVCFSLLGVSPCMLQSWAAGAGHCPRTQQCQAHTTLQEHTFSMGTVTKHFGKSSMTLPTLSPSLTCNSDTTQKAQMSTALIAWLAQHLGNRLMTLWYILL